MTDIRINLNEVRSENPFKQPLALDRRSELREKNLELYSYGIDQANYLKVLELDPNLSALNELVSNPQDALKMEKVTKLFSLIALDRGLGKEQNIKVNGEKQIEPACLMPKRNKLLAQIRKIFDRRLYESNGKDFTKNSQNQINELGTNVFRYGGDEFCILGFDENGQLKLYMLDVANLKGSDNAAAGNFYLTAIGNIIQSELENLSRETKSINDKTIIELVEKINSTHRKIPTKSSPSDLTAVMKQMSVTCHTEELAIPEINSKEFKIWLDGVYRGEVLSLDQCKFQTQEEVDKLSTNPTKENQKKSENQEFIRRTSVEKKEYVKQSLGFLAGTFQDFDELCIKYTNESKQSINANFYNEIYDTMYHSLFDDLNIDRTVNEMINLGEVYATITVDFKLKPMNQNHALGDKILQSSCKALMTHLFGEEMLSKELRQYVSINQTACCPYVIIKRDYDLLLKKSIKTPEEAKIIQKITKALENAKNFEGFSYQLDNGQKLNFLATGISDIGANNLGINREVQAQKFEAISKSENMSNFNAGILSRNMHEVADKWLLKNIDIWLSMMPNQLDNYLKLLKLKPNILEEFITKQVNPPIKELSDSRLLKLFDGSEQVFMEWKLWNSPIGEGLKEGRVLKPLKNNRVSHYGERSLSLMEANTNYNQQDNSQDLNSERLIKLKMIREFLTSRVSVVV